MSPFSSSRFFFYSFLIVILFFSSCDFFSKNNEVLLSEEETLAVVNSKKILLSNFQSHVRKFLERLPELKGVYEKDSKIIKEIVINQLIENELLLQEAVRRRISIPHEELETITNNALIPYAGANTESWLRSYGLSSEEWKAEYTKILTIQKLIDQEVNSKIEITEKNIRKYFNENREEFNTKPSYEIQHILVNSNDTAISIRKKIIRKANFEDLVNNYSIAADKTNGGNLGFVEEGILPYELNNAIFKLKE